MHRDGAASLQLLFCVAKFGFPRPLNATVSLHEIKIGCALRFDLTAQIVIAADQQFVDDCHSNYAHAHEGRPFFHRIRRVDVRRADERYGSSHFGRACVTGELDAVN
jgi:hypothetical protein